MSRQFIDAFEQLFGVATLDAQRGIDNSERVWECKLIDNACNGSFEGNYGDAVDAVFFDIS